MHSVLEGPFRRTGRVVFGIALALMVFAGCESSLVEDDLPDGYKEVLHQLASAELSANRDGSGQLDFTYRYGLGMVDSEGIAEITWTYQLVNARSDRLASEEQRMREAQLDRTQILVEGRRQRSLEIPPGSIQSGETYVIWFILRYRGEILSEFLEEVTEGEAYMGDDGGLPARGF